MEDMAIPRETVVATITLSTGRSISGEIQIDLNSRLSDFMNLPERFMVIRDRNQALKVINKDFIVEINLQ
jgi:hypothetical protein